ncbi:sulfite exporter TauE/SafE family protein [Thalassotalea atypica]|uniref:sulfite exporter TauE/SafE family protein n=1 Tax=Thalassotalea atypica TaxID=2054316 RepID=UPI0025736656|nr:sulfite exporter TauE/SafE family protein [Thalassotalea atypica]
MTVELILQLIALGTSVGFMAGLLGIGGGGIFVPVLTSLFLANHVESTYVVHLALGTSMTTIVATSLSSMLAHNKHKNVLWPIVKKMVPAIIVGAFITTFVVVYINSKALALFFTIFMAYVSFKMAFGGKKPLSAEHAKQASMFPALGIGSISTLVAIGGGSLTVPYLVSLGNDIKKAIGTSAAIGFPLAIAGSLGYLINGWNIEVSSSLENSGIIGFVHLPAVVILSICGFISAPIGANFANKLPMATLKKIFATLLLALSIKMMLSVF